ncbi:LOW QUALITY PROTEIN: polyhomeotic-like protein 3 [Antennarius striatus]|uniref:LOW QUALITY PROTEIN: polyhomeotic-like protein 3 n=1 Tax=Antennarius striatus TaxID=241820 RepID=UPI0035B4CE5C
MDREPVSHSQSERGEPPSNSSPPAPTGDPCPPTTTPTPPRLTPNPSLLDTPTLTPTTSSPPPPLTPAPSIAASHAPKHTAAAPPLPPHVLVPTPPRLTPTAALRTYARPILPSPMGVSKAARPPPPPLLKPPPPSSSAPSSTSASKRTAPALTNGSTRPLSTSCSTPITPFHTPASPPGRQVSQPHPVSTPGLVRANQSPSPARQRVSPQTLLLGKGLGGAGQDQVLLRAQMLVLTSALRPASSSSSSPPSSSPASAQLQSLTLRPPPPGTLTIPPSLRLKSPSSAPPPLSRPQTPFFPPLRPRPQPSATATESLTPPSRHLSVPPPTLYSPVRAVPLRPRLHSPNGPRAASAHQPIAAAPAGHASGHASPLSKPLIGSKSCPLAQTVAGPHPSLSGSSPFERSPSAARQLQIIALSSARQPRPHTIQATPPGGESCDVSGQSASSKNRLPVPPNPKSSPLTPSSQAGDPNRDPRGRGLPPGAQDPKGDPKGEPAGRRPPPVVQDSMGDPKGVGHQRETGRRDGPAPRQEEEEHMEEGPEPSLDQNPPRPHENAVPTPDGEPATILAPVSAPEPVSAPDPVPVPAPGLVSVLGPGPGPEGQGPGPGPAPEGPGPEGPGPGPVPAPEGPGPEGPGPGSGPGPEGPGSGPGPEGPGPEGPDTGPGPSPEGPVQSQRPAEPQGDLQPTPQEDFCENMSTQSDNQSALSSLSSQSPPSSPFITPLAEHPPPHLTHLSLSQLETEDQPSAATGQSEDESVRSSPWEPRAWPEGRQVLTHLVGGFVIQEGLQPFPVNRSSLLVPEEVTKQQEVNGTNGKAVLPVTDPLKEPDQSTDSEQEEGGDTGEPVTRPAPRERAVLHCQFCGKRGHAHSFMRSKRFCSTSCARGFNVRLTKRLRALSAGGGRSDRPRPPLSRAESVPGKPLLLRLPRDLWSAGRREKEGKGAATAEEEEDMEEDDAGEEDPDVAVTTRMDPWEASRTRRASEPALTVSTPTTTFRPGPAHWSVEEVTAFIHTLPGCGGVAEAFRLQEIDGQALLLLTEDHLMTSMNIKLGPALKICAHINALKNQ